MKRLLILPLALMLVGYTTSSCSSSQSEKAQNDSIAAAELEVARLDSIRQDSLLKDSLLKDSIAFYEFSTPDLVLFNLKGHVKEVQGYFNSKPGGYTYPTVLPFDCWYTATFSYDGELIHATNVKHDERDEEGYITSYNYRDDDYSEGAYIEWKNNRIHQSSTYSRYYRTEATPVWRVDLIKAYTQKNFDGNGDLSKEILGEIEYLSVDEFGNWTECKINEEIKYADGSKETCTEEFSRTITYYNKDNGREEAKIAQKEVNDYKNQREEQKSIPDWIQGVWHLDIDGPNGISVSNCTITISGNNATFVDGRTTKYVGECHVEDGYLYLGTYKRYKIDGKSLVFMGRRLTKDGEGSSFNGTFRTDSDVMRYLTDRTFYSDSHRMAFTYNGVTIDGRTVSGAPRISNFSSSSATMNVISHQLHCHQHLEK